MPLEDCIKFSRKYKEQLRSYTRFLIAIVQLLLHRDQPFCERIPQALDSVQDALGITSRFLLPQFCQLLEYDYGE